MLGETVIDFPVADNKTWPEAMALHRALRREVEGAPAHHAGRRAARALHRLGSAPAEVRAFSDRTGAPVVIHVAETRKEVEDVTRDHGARPVEYLARIGFLSPRIDRRAHGSSDRRARSAAQTARRRVGPQPAVEHEARVGRRARAADAAAGVRLGLGTDGAASNNDLSMWEEMDTAAKLHKLSSNDPKVVTAEEALAMATIGGARALHMDAEIGSLEEGKRADLVVVDLDALHQTPRYNIYSHLVYATKASDVRTVVIEGRVVMRDRRLLTLNEPLIKQRARAIRERITRSLAVK